MRRAVEARPTGRIPSRLAALVLLGPACARAGDGLENVPLCTAPGEQRAASVCPDGRGGAFVVWEDRRDGHADIYAQRFGPEGSIAPGWPTDGAVLCGAPRDQTRPQALSDGMGGALAVWQDERGGAADIYAQRIGAEGRIAPGWPADGVLLCAAPGNQTDPVAVGDGAGGALVAWTDHRAFPASDIYAQHVLARGRADARWPPNGAAVCTAPGMQAQPVAVADGAGGAVVAWQDARNGGTNDIYAQRVRSNGAVDPEWEPGGEALCTAEGEQQFPAIAPDGAGGAVVAWQDYRGTHYDIFAQHVSATGVVGFLWPIDGAPVCVEAGGQFAPAAAADGHGGAIVAWFDGRSGAGYDIYALRIGARGEVAPGWAFEGVTLCAAPGDQLYPAMVADGGGGALVAWHDRRSGDGWDVYAARITGAGTPGACWPLDGVAVCTAGGDQQWPALAPDGRGGALLAWADARSGAAADLFGAVLTLRAGAAPEWPETGVALCTAPGDQRLDWETPRAVQALPDGAGGAYVVWRDERGGAGSDIYVQRIGAGGEIAPGWPADGAAACAAPGDQWNPTAAPDGAGGLFVAWMDLRGGAGTDVYLQRVTAEGTSAAGWPAEGLAVCGAAGDQLAPALAEGGAGSVFVAWQDLRAAVSDVYVQHVRGDGALFPGWPVNGRPAVPVVYGSRTGPRLVANGTGGAVVAWREARQSGPYDVFAIALTAAGGFVSGWPATGLPLCVTPSDQHALDVVTDGAGGAIVAWRERGSSGFDDVRAQRVLGRGVLAPGWPAGGAAIYVHEGNAGAASLTLEPDGAGGALAAWSDARRGRWGVFVQRLGPDGRRVAGWPENGAAVTPGGQSAQVYPCLGADPEGGAIVVWVDLAGGARVRVQHVDGSGRVAAGWPLGGVPAGSGAGQQIGAALATDRRGCPIVAWSEAPTGSHFDLFAARVQADRGIASEVAQRGVDGGRAVAVWPNPSAAATHVAFEVASAGDVRVHLFDARGQRVRVLLHAPAAPGLQVVTWDGRGEDGVRLAAGTYFARIVGQGLRAPAACKVIRSR